MSTLSPAIAIIVDRIGSVDAVAPASSLGAPPLVNAHIHLPPNFSAFDTTAQAVCLASAEHVAVLGASNYYDYGVYTEFATELAARGIFPLFGLEIISLIDDLVTAGVKINDPGNPGKMYLCGKAITKFDPLIGEAAELLGTIRDADSKRMAAVAEKLAGVFQAAGLDTGLSEGAVKDRIVARHGSPKETVYLQERHIAQAFQEVLFELVAEDKRTEFLTNVYGVAPKAKANDAVGTQTDIRSFLMKAGKPGYVPETFVGFDHSFRAILALGGIPSYPVLGDGVTPLCGFESPIDGFIESLKSSNIHAAEFIPLRNSPELLSEYVHALRDAGLVVTAGTEHNTLDLVPIAPACVGGAAIPSDVAEIFWEGVCVLAAHQYLTAIGKPGFVDGNGIPNADYATADERIKAFSLLGATIIDRFRNQS